MPNQARRVKHKIVNIKYNIYVAQYIQLTQKAMIRLNNTITCIWKKFIFKVDSLNQYRFGKKLPGILVRSIKNIWQ